MDFGVILGTIIKLAFALASGGALHFWHIFLIIWAIVLVTLGGDVEIFDDFWAILVTNAVKKQGEINRWCQEGP